MCFGGLSVWTWGFGIRFEYGKGGGALVLYNAWQAFRVPGVSRVYCFNEGMEVSSRWSPLVQEEKAAIDLLRKWFDVASSSSTLSHEQYELIASLGDMRPFEALLQADDLDVKDLIKRLLQFHTSHLMKSASQWMQAELKDPISQLSAAFAHGRQRLAAPRQPGDTVLTVENYPSQERITHVLEQLSAIRQLALHLKVDFISRFMALVVDITACESLDWTSAENFTDAHMTAYEELVRKWKSFTVFVKGAVSIPYTTRPPRGGGR